MNVRCATLTLLALAGSAAAPGLAAQNRDALRRGHAAYDLADNATAIPLLSRGLDPAAGPRDSLWRAGVHKLVDALLAQTEDSIAAAWARWAVRQANALTIDEVNFSPAVAQVFREARRAVDRTPIPRGVSVSWRWDAGEAGRMGRVLIPRTTVAVNARIGSGDFITSGSGTSLRVGSHQLLATSDGFLPERATVEVLPGVTTVVTFQLAPAAAGVVSVRSLPWGRVLIDQRPVGWSSLLQRATPGSHRISVTRDGYRTFDTTITVARDDTTRLAIRLQRPDGTRHAAPPAQWMVASALDSADVPGTLIRIREQIGMTPPSAASVRARLYGYAGLSHLALGFTDSARVAFREAVREDPFAGLDSARANPDAVALFAATRRDVAVAGLRAPADTSLVPEGHWPVTIAVGAPGSVKLRLLREGGAPLDSTLTTVRVDSVAVVMVSLRDGRGSLLANGQYRLVGDRMGDTTSRWAPSLQLDVARLVVDTASHDIPPPLRPETRRGPPSAWSLFRGLFFGAAAATLPIVLSGDEREPRGVDVRAVTVSATLVTAGVVGVFAGRPRLPVPQNIELNRSLRGAWEGRNRAIAADNEQRRLEAPVRIQSRGRS